MAKMGRSKMHADLKRQRLIAEIANYLMREPSLDHHSDHICDVAFRSPQSDVWVWFGDLPDATAAVLWEKHSPRLAFPAGLPFFGGER
jgi:hypothetical protein